MKLEFSRQSFEKYRNFKLGKSRSSGSRLVSCVYTNRQACRNY